MSAEILFETHGSNVMRDAGFSRRDMLRAASALAVGAAFAEPLKAAAPESRRAGPESASWVDAAMPELTHRMIETNGNRMHVAEQGASPLVILCHGFPECWYSWRHQLRALVQAGFRAVAPDLRGYGRSDRPQEVEKYTILHPEVSAAIIDFLQQLWARNEKAEIRGAMEWWASGRSVGISLAAIPTSTSG